MCGIVAVVSAYDNGFSYAEMEMYRDLIFMDTLRGVDSTGVFGVDKYGNVQIHKEASPGPWFIGTKEFKSFSADLVRDGRFAVAHNRAATRGTVNDQNAHPFCVDDKLVLVQNGTYYGSHDHIAQTEVDTEAIAHLLAREPDISKALQQVNAAYAFIWYDVQKKQLNFIRNDDRPLYVAYTEHGGIVFASEGEMIVAAAARRKIKLEKPPYLMEKHNLFTLTFHKDSMDSESKKLDCSYRGSPFQGGNSRYYQSHWNMGGEGWEDCYDRCLPFVPETPKKTPITEEAEELKVSCVEALYKTGQEPYSAKEMSEMEALFKTGKDLVLDIYDYIHGNDHKDCMVFHVIGTPVMPFPIARPPVFYWTVYGKTELEVMEMVSKDNLWTCSVGPRIDRVYLGHDNRRSWMACYCAMQPQMIEEATYATQ